MAFTSSILNLAPLTANGQIWIGNTGGTGYPTPGFITGTGATTVTLNAGGIVINTPPPIDGNLVLQSSSTTMAINTKYQTTGSSRVVLTLPTTIPQGSVFKIVGQGSGGWQIAQNAGQQIIFYGNSTTSGTSGYLQSNTANDNIELHCLTANTLLTVVNAAPYISGN